MNGLHNGLYGGFENGLHPGLFPGLWNNDKAIDSIGIYDRNKSLWSGLVLDMPLKIFHGVNTFDRVSGIKGTLVGAAVPASSQRGNCVSFAGGTTDAIDLGTPSQLNLSTSPITFEALVYWVGVSGTPYYVMADFNPAGSASSMLMSKTNTGGGNKFQFGWTGMTTALAASSPVTDTWYHVVGIRSGKIGAWTATIYVNDIQGTTQTTAVDPGAQQQFKIGRPGSAVGTFSWNKLINYVRIWNRALSRTEVSQLYSYSNYKFQ